MANLANVITSQNRLTKMYVRGFKSIREMELDFYGLNVLIGANGAGKSNFLSFFRMLNYITSKNLRLFVGQSGGANSLLYYGAKRTPQLECKLVFETDAGINEYAMCLVSAAGDELIFADEQVSFSRYNRDTRALLVSLGAGHRETMLMEQTDDAKGNAKTAAVIRNIMNNWRQYINCEDVLTEALAGWSLWGRLALPLRKFSCWTVLCGSVLRVICMRGQGFQLNGL